MNRVQQFENNFLKVFTSFYILFAILPTFKFFPFFNYLMIFMVILFIYIYFFIDSSYFSSIQNDSLLALLVIFSFVSLAVGSRNISTGLNYLIYVHLIFSFSLFRLISKQTEVEYFLRSILKISLIIFFVVNLITFINLLFDPYASRLAKVDEADIRLLAGIGGYNFIYASTVLLVSMIPFLYKLQNFDKKTKVFIISFFILGVLTVIASNFFTALLILLIGAYFFYLQHKPIQALLLFLVCLIVAIFTIPIFEELIGISSMNFLKLLEVSSLLQDGDVGSYTYGRIDRYEEGLYGIQNYTLFGMMNEGLNVIRNYGYSQHSALLDSISLYGIFLGLAGFIILLYPFNSLNIKSKILRNSFRASIVAYLVILCLNVNTIDIMVTMFLVIPVFLKYMDNILIKYEKK